MAAFFTSLTPMQIAFFVNFFFQITFFIGIIKSKKYGESSSVASQLLIVSFLVQFVLSILMASELSHRK
ncbi:hypothetical protein [Tuwongella immobilis]|uniref:Uncharacterized protein n=1 Tax=Tuwongella immobilis TaxID=692036 RepID=A0A6C2YPT6_9BACT|nr:hypothetical protein [Tuwongella immobilis]VIP03648.1 unnamed protein product [Tuwongella immobilis]VTS04664.1 unnamed protein product [Tuwongella immobilis]